MSQHGEPVTAILQKRNTRFNMVISQIDNYREEIAEKVESNSRSTFKIKIFGYYIKNGRIEVDDSRYSHLIKVTEKDGTYKVRYYDASEDTTIHEKYDAEAMRNDPNQVRDFIDEHLNFEVKQVLLLENGKIIASVKYSPLTRDKYYFQ
jgi:hypothetical protein